MPPSTWRRSRTSRPSCASSPSRSCPDLAVSWRALARNAALNINPRSSQMQIGVPAETMVGETRVAVTPETAKKLKSQGHTLRVAAGAGLAASVTDQAYQAAGAEITDQAGAFACELVLK